MTTETDKPIDLANWMKNLPPALRSLSITNVAIPGTHNAMMYTVMKNSPSAPDAPRHLDVLNRIFPSCVQNWLLTQRYTIRQQLEHGIRFFDIRTSYVDGSFRFCHGLYSFDNLQPLEDINTFLTTHPSEVVILDFQHVYNCDRELHQRYCDTIISIFGPRILPRHSNNLADSSIESMTASGQQVVVIYRKYSDEKKQFWSSNNFPTPWPNTMSRTRLKEILDVNIELRDMENGFVTQCVLTPTIQYIMLHPFGSVRDSCAKRVLRKLDTWIEQRPVGPKTFPTFNVFIADYVDLEDDKFTKTVINLNFKMDGDESANCDNAAPEVTDLE